jgi:NTP pyrophosphatase (non-canonical NTP hydrolase)
VAKNDSNTVLEDLKREIETFCTERDWDQFHGLKDLSMGLATEASEIMELFRFKSDDECTAVVNGSERYKVEDELADVLFFVLRMAQKYDIDLATSFARKMQKNRNKYPVEKSKGSNKKYTEL